MTKTYRSEESYADDHGTAPPTDIERAARAIRHKFVQETDAQECARAVLSAALSEPSEEMVEAANVVYLKAYRSGTSSLAGDMRAALVAVGKLFEGRI